MFYYKDTIYESSKMTASCDVDNFLPDTIRHTNHHCNIINFAQKILASILVLQHITLDLELNSSCFKILLAISIANGIGNTMIVLHKSKIHFPIFKYTFKYN